MLFGATLFIALAALTSVASSKIGEPDVNGAVAAALKHQLTDLLGADAVGGKDAAVEPFALCVESVVSLDMDAIERDFSGTVIQPVPESACTSETIEGDFGMFSAITRYYDARGAEAAHRQVAGASCPDTRTCVVDIDSRGAGERFITRREGQAWSVVERRTRWVV